MAASSFAGSLAGPMSATDASCTAGAAAVAFRSASSLAAPEMARGSSSARSTLRTSLPADVQRCITGFSRSIGSCCGADATEGVIDDALRVAGSAPLDLLGSRWLPLAAVLVAMARCEQMRARCLPDGRQKDAEDQRRVFRKRYASGDLDEVMQVELVLTACLPGQRLEKSGDSEEDRAYLHARGDGPGW